MNDTWVKTHYEEGASCPCCGQFVKLYKRQLNSMMARQLLAIWKHYAIPGNWRTWLHASTYLRTCGLDRECAKLRFWGLIDEQSGSRDDGGKHRGFYHITERGVDFAAGMTTVPKFIYCYNNQLVELDEPDPTRIHITDALGSRFDYDELMDATSERTI